MEGIGNNPFTGISFDNDNTGTLLYANGNNVDFTYAGGDGMLAINTSGRNKSSVTVEYNINNNILEIKYFRGDMEFPKNIISFRKYNKSN